MKRNELLYVIEIIENIIMIENSTKGVSFADFLNNLELRDATIRRLEIIGEACRNISRQTRESHPEVEWSGAIGTRDRVIHQYFRIDFDVVWNVLKKDLPALKKQMERIKKELADK